MRFFLTSIREVNLLVFLARTFGAHFAMSESSPSWSDPPPPPNLTQLLAMMEVLCQQNEILQDSIHILQTQSQQDGNANEELMDSQPLFEAIWDDQVPENFKPPWLVSFDGKIDPHEHIVAINNQMAIIGASGSLKCKLMTSTLKEEAMRWYMSLPRFSIVSYQNLTKEMVQHFSASRHRKVLTTSLFNVSSKGTRSLSESIWRGSTKKPLRCSIWTRRCSWGHFNLASKSGSSMNP